MPFVADLVVSNLTPRRIPVHGDPGMERMHWALRFASHLPEPLDEDAINSTLTRAAKEAVRAAFDGRGLAPSPAQARTSVVFRRVDRGHAVLVVETIAFEQDVAHAWLAGASAALSALNRLFPIEDVQGTPRRFWQLIANDSL
jgi:hypothetical protein